MLFDTHAHVTFSQFDDDRSEVIARARAAGLRGWLEVGTDVAASKQAIALAEQEEGVIASVGVHPSDIAGLTDAAWEELSLLLTNERVRAVGEVGLDYYHTPPDLPSEQDGLRAAGRGDVRELQLSTLKRFHKLALQHDLPMIFHIRDGDTVSANDDVLEWLESLSSDKVPRGVMHTFSGSPEQAQRYLALGLYLSFSGVITFKNAGANRIVAENMPLDRILIETDSPFLAPEPYRGKQNEPAYVALVAQKIASVRSMPVAELANATTDNAQRLFSFG